MPSAVGDEVDTVQFSTRQPCISVKSSFTSYIVAPEHDKAWGTATAREENPHQNTQTDTHNTQRQTHRDTDTQTTETVHGESCPHRPWESDCEIPSEGPRSQVCPGRTEAKPMHLLEGHEMKISCQSCPVPHEKPAICHSCSITLVHVSDLAASLNQMILISKKIQTLDPRP